MRRQSQPAALSPRRRRASAHRAAAAPREASVPAAVGSMAGDGVAVLAAGRSAGAASRDGGRRQAGLLRRRLLPPAQGGERENADADRHDDEAAPPSQPGACVRGRRSCRYARSAKCRWASAAPAPPAPPGAIADMRCRRACAGDGIEAERCDVGVRCGCVRSTSSVRPGGVGVASVGISPSACGVTAASSARAELLRALKPVGRRLRERALDDRACTRPADPA